MANPTETHLDIAYEALRYLDATKHYKLNFRKSKEGIKLEGYSDADWANLPECHSTSGYAFKSSSDSALISWRSAKQPVVATSTVEAEYIAASEATKEALFLRQILADLTGQPPEPVRLCIDSQGALTLASHQTQHRQTKHIDIKIHHIRCYVHNKSIFLHYVKSMDNIADIMTKPVARPTFKRFASIHGERHLP